MKLRFYVIGLIALFVAIAAFKYPGNEENIKETVMTTEENIESIESLRAEYDTQLMELQGVVSVSTAIDKDGKPYLKIGTSIPTEEVRKKLPKELFRVPVELEYVGEIRAQ